tara:strand:- start:2423 stop:2545 length:123 start_codon:yes stop_codon:yes gene_type:complete
MTAGMSPEELFEAMDITPTAEVMYIFKKSFGSRYKIDQAI